MIRLATLILICFSCACKAQKTNQQNGSLLAAFDIGPLCPQEPCNLSPTEKSRFFNDFQLVIADSNGIERHRLAIDTNGLIRKSLSPGNYSAGIRPLNFPKGASLDLTTFRIIAGKESKIKLFFDTGLR